MAHTLNRASRSSRSLRRAAGIPVPKFGSLLKEVGDEGRHQNLLLYAVLLPLSLYIPFGSSSLRLLLSTPDHHCKVPGRELFNVSKSLWRKITIPWTRSDDGRVRFSRCLMRNVTITQDPSAGITNIAIDPYANTSCQYGTVYDHSAWQATASTTYNLVCDDAYVVPLIFGSAVAANVIGTLLFSFMADRYGRRPTFFTCLVLSSVFGLMNLFSPNWQVFAATKFLSSMPYFALYQLPYIILVELSSDRMRGRTAALCSISITIGLGLLALLAWLVNHWKKLGALCYLPSVAFFIYLRYLPESPRWLLDRGRVVQCGKILQQIAERNQKGEPPDLLPTLELMYQQQTKLPRFLTLITVPNLRKRIIIVTLKTCVLCVSHSGILYNIRNVTSNEFVNFFALSLVDIPGNLLGMASAQFLGRRLTTVYTQFIAAGFCFLASVTTSSQLPLTVLCSLGKLFLTSTVLVVFMQVGELFPTCQRAIAYGISGSLGLASSAAVPSIMALGHWSPSLPYCVLGMLCIIGALISCLLPETMKRPLPQTISEANAIGNLHKLCGCISLCGADKQKEEVNHNMDFSGSDEELSGGGMTSRIYV
ncbi:organic cation transporter 1 [Hyalella azteca]|uniref:Organic cation transporter 1 n=1 Tax=Hyalella azteca TaxID=294128 RepID=A0A8B7PP68_HYAAZ|nr:organic cation transporter 1 [Hyalella azteca]